MSKKKLPQGPTGSKSTALIEVESKSQPANQDYPFCALPKHYFELCLAKQAPHPEAAFIIEPWSARHAK